MAESEESIFMERTFPVACFRYRERAD
jgi:hypothetical protein